LSGISIAAVAPPAASARVPVAKPSQSERPGSALYRKRTGVDVSILAGAGAAGGTAGGLAALGARLRSGFEVVAEAVSLDTALAGADLVVTGEGKLDASSLAGKVVGEVLRRTPHGARRAVIAGQVRLNSRGDIPAGVIIEALTARATSEPAAMRDASIVVRAAARDIGRRTSLIPSTR
jgi:glycerate kinase